MKLSVSLSDEDVAALDRFVELSGLTSRSAAVQRAIRLLGDPSLQADYGLAWTEWDDSGEAELWESTASDGMVDAAR